MNYQDWYTDRMDVHRITAGLDGALTLHKREPAAEDVPCRIHPARAHGPRMQPTAAYTESEDKLACANSVDVRAGDELLIRRGGGLGERRPVIRAFAGDPVYYHEPFGAVMPGLAHQEIGLLQKEYVEGAAGEEDGNGAG